MAMSLPLSEVLRSLVSDTGGQPHPEAEDGPFVCHKVKEVQCHIPVPVTPLTPSHHGGIFVISHHHREGEDSS